MGCEAHNTISDAARPRWGGCSHGCCDNKGWENYEVAPRTAGALVGAPTVDQLGHLTAILVAESIDVDGPPMLTENLKDRSPLSGTDPVTAEPVRTLELSPMVPATPHEEKITH